MTRQRRQPLSPEMEYILKRLREGARLHYRTTESSYGHYWFEPDLRTVRANSIEGLYKRGMIAFKFDYPRGRVVWKG